MLNIEVSVFLSPIAKEGLTCKFMCSDYSLLCTVKLRDQQHIYIY